MGISCGPQLLATRGNGKRIDLFLSPSLGKALATAGWGRGGGVESDCDVEILSKVLAISFHRLPPPGRRARRHHRERRFPACTRRTLPRLGRICRGPGHRDPGLLCDGRGRRRLYRTLAVRRRHAVHKPTLRRSVVVHREAGVPRRRRLYRPRPHVCRRVRRGLPARCGVLGGGSLLRTPLVVRGGAFRGLRQGSCVPRRRSLPRRSRALPARRAFGAALRQCVRGLGALRSGQGRRVRRRVRRGLPDGARLRARRPLLRAWRRVCGGHGRGLPGGRLVPGNWGVSGARRRVCAQQRPRVPGRSGLSRQRPVHVAGWAVRRLDRRRLPVIGPVCDRRALHGPRRPLHGRLPGGLCARRDLRRRGALYAGARHVSRHERRRLSQGTELRGYRRVFLRRRSLPRRRRCRLCGVGAVPRPRPVLRARRALRRGRDGRLSARQRLCFVGVVPLGRRHSGRGARRCRTANSWRGRRRATPSSRQASAASTSATAGPAARDRTRWPRARRVPCKLRPCVSPGCRMSNRRPLCVARRGVRGTGRGPGTRDGRHAPDRALKAWQNGRRDATCAGLRAGRPRIHDRNRCPCATGRLCVEPARPARPGRRTPP